MAYLLHEPGQVLHEALLQEAGFLAGAVALNPEPLKMG